MGAAILAGLGAGVFSGLDQAVRMCVAERDGFRPCPKLAGIYREGYGLFRSLYPALKPLFRDSARISLEN